MRLRTIYFKVVDMAPSRAFWSGLLRLEPQKDFEDWCEFGVGEVRFALLRLDEAEPGAACVPVFQLPDPEATRAEVARAVELGASIFIDGLDDPDSLSVVLHDPAGNQFELTTMHD